MSFFEVFNDTFLPQIVRLDAYQILKYQRLLAFYWLIKYAFVADVAK